MKFTVQLKPADSIKSSYDVIKNVNKNLSHTWANTSFSLQNPNFHSFRQEMRTENHESKSVLMKRFVGWRTPSWSTLIEMVRIV